jgi:L-fuconolactonase
MTVVDAHQHVWNLDRARYDWLDADAGPIFRTFEFEDVQSERQLAGIDATVLVQATDNLADTKNMRRVAAGNPDVAGIVGWLPLEDTHAAEEALAELSADTHIVGIRSLIQNQPDDTWITHAAQDASLGLLAQAGLSFDYVTNSPELLRHVPGISARHPDLRLVIDHLGKPPIGGTIEQRTRWKELLQSAAENPNVYAKLSGLYSSVGDMGAWTTESVKPFVDDAVDIFGADRLMFGSDWPIAVLAGGFQRTWMGLRAMTADLSHRERDAIQGGAAIDFYRLVVN